MPIDYEKYHLPKQASQKKKRKAKTNGRKKQEKVVG